MLKDVSKRIGNCALQKDFAFINTQFDKKADVDYVNEMLG